TTWYPSESSTRAEGTRHESGGGGGPDGRGLLAVEPEQADGPGGRRADHLRAGAAQGRGRRRDRRDHRGVGREPVLAGPAGRPVEPHAEVAHPAGERPVGRAPAGDRVMGADGTAGPPPAPVLLRRPVQPGRLDEG